MRTSSVLLRRPARRTYATLLDGPHGYKLAAKDNGEATSSVSLVFKAGPRYEPVGKNGISNVWRNFAFKNTESRTALGIVRETELYGGVLSSSIGRERVVVTAEFLRGDEDYFASLLASLHSTLYTRHELNESVLPSSSALPSALSAADVALEQAHKLAFRFGLGKPLFSTPSHDISLNDVKAFGSSAWTTGNVGVVATGLEQGALENLVQKYFPKLAPATGPEASTSGKSVYHGGLATLDNDGHSGSALFVGFAVPGAPGGLAELSTLKALLSTTPSTKWGTSTSPLPASATPVLLPYTDASLFGILVTSPTKETASQAVSTLKSLGSASGVKKDDLSKALQKAKFEEAFKLDTRMGWVWGVASQMFEASQPTTTLEATISALDKVTPASLSKFTTTLLKSKPTFVIVGDGSEDIWSDEIGL